MVLLRGPSGSGKTKLLQALSGRLMPSSGKVLFCGEDIYGLKGHSLRDFRARCGFAFEKDTFINSLSVSGNLSEIIRALGIPSKVAFDRIMHVLKLCSLINSRDILPENLSSGEKKLFKLALALVKEPEVFLLDFNLCMDSLSLEIARILKSISSRGGAIMVTAADYGRGSLPCDICLDIQNGEIR